MNTKRCSVYYLPISKYKAFRVSIYPGRKRGTVSKVQFSKDGEEERTLESWELSKRSPFLSHPSDPGRK